MLRKSGKKHYVSTSSFFIYLVDAKDRRRMDHFKLTVKQLLKPKLQLLLTDKVYRRASLNVDGRCAIAAEDHTETAHLSAKKKLKLQFPQAQFLLWLV